MDLEQTAIGRIQLASQMSLTYYKQPIMVCISGGKDSDVLLELTRRAGVPFEIQHSHTTVDAPQTVYHVRDIFKRYEQNGIKCTLNKPKMTMWELIVHKKMPPTRLVRYCCSYLKEQNGKNRHILTVIDSDYRGSVGLPIHNDGECVGVIEPHERVAQIVFQKALIVDLELVDSLEDTDRGGNGFGSSGR